ncbi:MAG: peptidylprolyl isomerase, partial [bacterium]
MFRARTTFLIVSILLLATIGVYIYYRSNPILDSETVAIVNGDPISRKSFEERLSSVRMNYTPNETSKFAEIKQTILRRMILEQIIMQDAKRRDIKITDEELSRKIKSIKQGYTEDEFNQLITNQFKIMEDWVAEVKQELLIEKTLSKEVTDKINITEKELKEYYDKTYTNKMSEPKIKLEQIFTSNKDTAERLLIDIKNGANFEEIAKKHSEAPESKKGGLIGYITKGEGLEIFDNAFQMQNGEVSGVIQSDYGFHILKVIEHIAPSQVSFEEAKAFISSQMIR